MNRKSTKYPVFVCLCLCTILFGGCIIPFPHFKKTCGPICGYVVSADPNVPIENAVVDVYYSDNGYRKTITNASGYFSFPEKNRFYWGILFGVALNHSLPLDCHPQGYADLQINADGYDEKNVQAGWLVYTEHLDDPNEPYLSSQMMGCRIIPLYETNKLDSN